MEDIRILAKKAIQHIDSKWEKESAANLVMKITSIVTTNSYEI